MKNVKAQYDVYELEGELITSDSIGDPDSGLIKTLEPYVSEFTISVNGVEQDPERFSSEFIETLRECLEREGW